MVTSQVVAKLIREGHVVFSPISYTHSLCDLAHLDPHDPAWYTFDDIFLRRCDKLFMALNHLTHQDGDMT